MQDHDRLFKQLLTSFFAEFIQLFFSEIHQRIDWSSLEFLDKEVFSDQPKKRHVDLLVKVRTRKEDPLVLLIHVEHQAQSQSDFAERMFDYYCYLRIAYRLPVFPIALFSFDSPARLEPDQFLNQLLDLRVIDFKFKVIQLNRLRWSDFVRSSNPIAGALMAKMHFGVAERPIVKLQCLRLLVTLRLDPDKQKLIANFVNTYLQLTTEETKKLQQELQNMQPREAIAVQQVTNEWTKQGRREGLKLGRSQQQTKIVVNMHQKGLALDLIAAVTELRASQVEKILRKAGLTS